jgi:hypothetical protein
MLYASPRSVLDLAGAEIAGHRSAPGKGRGDDATRTLMTRIRQASSQMSEAFCAGGYPAFSGGRALSGSVVATDATETVTGVGTDFEAELRPRDSVEAGSIIVLGDVSYSVSSITSPTELELTDSHVGGFSGGALTIEGDAALVAQQVTACVLLVQRNLDPGTRKRQDTVDGALEYTLKWLEEVRGGSLCLSTFGGGSARPESFLAVTDPSTPGEFLTREQLACFEAVGA